MADNRYCIEYAKTGRSGCKKCKTPIEKGVPRIGKITPNPFSDDGGDMKVWYHTRCIFETLKVSLNTNIVPTFPSVYMTFAWGSKVITRMHRWKRCVGSVFT